MHIARTVFASGVLLALAMPALAAQGTAEDAPVSVTGFVDELRDGGFLDHVVYADVDGNGDLEGVAFLNTGPDPEDPELREWRVFDDEDGAVVQVGTWYGYDVKVVETRPNSTLDPVMSAVNSDGALWYLYKGKMRPFGDLVGDRVDFIMRGNYEDVDRFADFGFDKVPERDMAKVTIDVTDAPRNEELISLMGERYWKGDDAETPYVLLSSSGEEIHHGWSLTHPSIFRMPGGGFQIIEIVGLEYRAIFFPEESTP